MHDSVRLFPGEFRHLNQDIASDPFDAFLVVGVTHQMDDEGRSPIGDFSDNDGNIQPFSLSGCGSCVKVVCVDFVSGAGNFQNSALMPTNRTARLVLPSKNVRAIS